MTNDDTDVDNVRSRRGDERSTTGDEQVDWEDVPADPEPENLGYTGSQWERVPVTDDEQVIFLPGDEDDLADDAFVVLAERDLCDLVTRR